MSEKLNFMDDKSRLILHRTPREDIQNGISIMVKGEGVRVIDKEGRSYLDMVAGVTRPTHIGYGREEVARAAYDQMCKLHYFSPGGFANEPAMKLADLLAEITPEHDPPHVTIIVGEILNDPRGVIGRAIVDVDDLVV